MDFNATHNRFYTIEGSVKPKTLLAKDVVANIEQYIYLNIKKGFCSYLKYFSVRHLYNIYTYRSDTFQTHISTDFHNIISGLIKIYCLIAVTKKNILRKTFNVSHKLGSLKKNFFASQVKTFLTYDNLVAVRWKIYSVW